MFKQQTDLGNEGNSRAALESRIRARGPVLDMPFAQSLYRPLLEKQRRDGVEVIGDIPYGPDVRHRLDLYRPQAAATEPRAVMVFLPGGGFIRGDKADRENIGQHFARKALPS